MFTAPVCLAAVPSASKVVSFGRESMTNQTEESYTKLRKGFEAFPKICQEMEVSRLYCTCNRSSGSPCLMAEGVKKLLQKYLEDFEVAAKTTWQDCQNNYDRLAYFASRFFWSCISSETLQVPFYCLESWRQAEVSSVAEDLESVSATLFKKFEESPPAPPKEPVHLHIWKWFVDLLKQEPLRQLCIWVAYLSSCEGKTQNPQKDREWMAACLNKLKDVHLELGRREDVNSELRSILKSLASETARFAELFLTEIQSTYADYQVECMNNGKAPESHTQFIFRRRDDLWQSWSRVAALTCEVEEHVASLLSPEMKSDGSWSFISESPRDPAITVASPERLEEVESAVSGHSVDSQISCLSGQGGPHCFLPAHLFNALQSGVGQESPSAALVMAQDLRKGAKILSADGATIEVTKVEKQKTTKLVKLMDHAMPLTTTPHHRILVPSESEATTVMAVDLSLGSLVMCSDCMPKKVIRKTEYLVEEQEVLAITFHPDKAVACFLPPEEPVVLTKGLTPKETRRGGMARRGARQEVVSIPDTAAGEYED